jgi:hypothetical protein
MSHLCLALRRFRRRPGVGLAGAVTLALGIGAVGGVILSHWSMQMIAAPRIGMLESAGNILLLVLAVMIPVYFLMDSAITGADFADPFGTVSIANVILSGTVLVVSFHRHQDAATRQRRGGSDGGRCTSDLAITLALPLASTHLCLGMIEVT